MPQPDFNTFLPAAAVGVLSAAANVVEKQAKDRGTGGAFMQNASLWGDVIIGVYGLGNYAGWLPTNMPRENSNAALAMAGAGVALIARRASDWVGATVLGLQTGARYAPGRSMSSGRRSFPSLRSPGAAVETSVLPRKRQFFSVT